MLPWPIILMIAEASGCRWRFRVCRRLRDGIYFPANDHNIVDYEAALPFHASKMIKIKSSHIELRDYLVGKIPRSYVVVWEYDPWGDSLRISRWGIGSLWPDASLETVKGEINYHFMRLKYKFF